jgi:hypothetical protein
MQTEKIGTADFIGKEPGEITSAYRSKQGEDQRLGPGSDKPILAPPASARTGWGLRPFDEHGHQGEQGREQQQGDGRDDVQTALARRRTGVEEEPTVLLAHEADPAPQRPAAGIQKGLLRARESRYAKLE